MSYEHLLSPLEPPSRRWRVRIVVPALLILAACCALSATAAAVPNICRIAGVSKLVAADVLGKGSTFANAATMPTTPPNLGAYCAISPGPGRTLASLDVEFYAPSAFPLLVTRYEQGSARKALPGLGAGAVYLVSGDYNTDVVLFKTSKYTVLINNSAFGGQRPAYYPTKTEYLALARAVHTHIG